MGKFALNSMKQVSGKILFKVINRKSHIHGTGCWAVMDIPTRRKIGSLGGVVVSRKEANKLSQTVESIAIVELWNGKALDASRNANALRYVNHSCSPNTYLRVFNHHVEFYALRDIAQGEELTCDYGETHHEGTLPCKCGSPGCRGFI